MLRSLRKYLIPKADVIRIETRNAHTYGRQDRGLYGGTQIQFGCNVPDSHHKTARTFLPNVHQHTFRSSLLKRKISIRMTTGVLRTVKKYGGIDQYLLSNSKQIQKNLGLRGDALRAEMAAHRRKNLDAKRGLKGRIISKIDTPLPVPNHEKAEVTVESSVL